MKEYRKYRIGIVSYTNVLPFLYGLKDLDSIELIDEYPSKLVSGFDAGEYDLVLLPTGALNKVKGAKIVSNYCIGADGAVASVCLYSNDPIELVKKVYLDYQSATSVRLFKILANKFLKQNFVYQHTTDDNFIERVQDNVGILVIGDRTFGLQSRFKYVYDLAELWKNFTGLPFVFAAWVIKNELPEVFLDEFDTLLAKGINSIEATIKYFEGKRVLPNNEFLNDYLQNKISYILDKRKKKSIDLYLNYLRELSL